MSGIYLLLLGIVGIFAIGCSVALLVLGKMIDQFPVGDETKRSRSISSPIESTRISVAIFWIFFIIGTWALVQDSRFMLILGITTFFAICLFMFTALVFSFAVLNAMRGRQLNIDMPILQITPKGISDAIPAPKQVTPTPVLRKRYHNPISDFMLNALLKKE